MTAIITFGRFAPPTIGHALLFRKMEEAKKFYKADDALVYASHKQEPKKNPLAYEDKISFLKELLSEKHPELTVVTSKDRNVMDVMISLNGKYTDIVLVAGGDRLDEYETLLRKYNGKEYNYESIQIVSAGDRDPDAGNASGMSASIMRNAVKEGDYETFRKGVDSFNDKLILDMFNAVKAGMNLTEYVINRRDAFSLGELKEYCRVREQETGGSEKFMQRVAALYQKAGLDFSTEATTEEEVAPGETQAELTPEAEKIEQALPYEDPSTYTGTVGILFIDEVVGTKFLTNYIGEYYKALNESFQGEFTGLRVVVRQIRDEDDPTRKASLLGVKIAWSSEIGNPNFYNEKDQMSVDFALEETKDLLLTIGAGKTVINSLSATFAGNLLAQYIEKFNSELVKNNKEKKDLDYKSLNPILAKLGFAKLGNTVRVKEKEADTKLKEFALKGAELKQEEIDKFIKDYGVDKRIIGTRIQIEIRKDEKKKNPTGSSPGELENAFSELGDTLGLTPLLTLMDKVAEVEIAAKERKQAKPKA